MARPTKEEAARKQAEADEKFNAAVAAAVAAAVPQVRTEVENSLLKSLIAAGGTTGAQPTEGDRGFISALAFDIAKLNGQGTGKQPFVSPEILSKQAEAKQRMVALIVKARADGIIPGYRVTAKMFLNEILVEPQWQDPVSKSMRDTEINWEGIPNESMLPLDETATAIYSEYLNSIGAVPRGDSAETPWINVSGKLVRGMSGEQRVQSGQGASPLADPRRAGQGPSLAAKRVAVLGSVAAPATIS